MSVKTLKDGDKVRVTSGAWKKSLGVVVGQMNSVGAYSVKLDKCQIRIVFFASELSVAREPKQRAHNPDERAEEFNKAAFELYGEDVDYCGSYRHAFDLLEYASNKLMDAGQLEKFAAKMESQHPTAVLVQSDGELDYYDLGHLIKDIKPKQIVKAVLFALDKLPPIT